MRIVLGFCLILFFLGSCSSLSLDKGSASEATNENWVDTVHTSKNSLDWAGTYKGILPCENCPGIETTLSIDYDSTFEREMVYLEKDKTEKQKGILTWSKDGRRIQLFEEDHKKSIGNYMVGENYLLELNKKGRPHTKQQDSTFRLTKIQGL